jgi:hypothetical protein
MTDTQYFMIVFHLCLILAYQQGEGESLRYIWGFAAALNAVFAVCSSDLAKAFWRGLSGGGS